MEIKKTSLTKIHESLGAKMIPFAGYSMPLQYNGVIAEHQNVRENVGVFDVSHMGEFIVRGPGSIDLVQKITSNDASSLLIGKVQYSCFPNINGGIVDDLLVYRLNELTYMLVVNASNIEKDWNWLVQHNTDCVDIENISDQTSLLAIQGPKASQAIQSLTDISLSDMKYYTSQKGIFAGIENILISSTGYTGAGGFEIYFKTVDAVNVWNKIFDAGKDLHIMPAGLAARDTLRLEMGFCLYGNDIDETTSPLEAGLSWITKFTTNFIGSYFLKEQKKIGCERRLVGFELLDRGVPRYGYPVVDKNGNQIGQVTSGTISPSLNKAIGLAYIPLSMKALGTEIFIQVRKKKLKAKVVSVPFYKI